MVSLKNLADTIKKSFSNLVDNEGWFRQGQFAPIQQTADIIGNYRGPTGVTVKEAFQRLPQQAMEDWGNAGLVKNNPIIPQSIKPAFSTAIRLGPASYMNSMAKGVTTFARPTSNFEKIGDIAGMIGANMPSQAGNQVLNGLIGTGFNAVDNLSKGRPITENFIPSYQQGVDFGFKLGPISSVAHAALNPTLTKILGSTSTPISKYLELASKAATPEIKNQILKVAVQRFGAGVVKDAIIGGVGMGAYGTTEPAKNSQERINNVLKQAGMGATFGVGTKVLGTGLDVGFNNILPSIQNPSPEAIKNMKGGIDVKPIHPDDLIEMRDFVDYVRGVFHPGDKPVYESSIRDMAQKYGINPERPNSRIAADFDKILQKQWDIKLDQPKNISMDWRSQGGYTQIGGEKVNPTKVEGKLAPEKGKVNVENLNLTPEEKLLLRQIDKGRTSVITNAETKARAEQLGPRSKTRTDKQIADITAQSHAANQEAVTAVKELTRLNQSGASELEKLAQFDKIANAADVAMGEKKLAGTLLQAQQIMADETMSLPSKIIKLFDEAGVPREKYKGDFVNIDWNNKAAVDSLFRKYVPPKFSEVLRDVRYTNMLSSPVTHITNIATNFLQTGIVRPITRTIEGQIDWTKHLLTGSERKYFASSGLDYAKGYYSALPEAFKKAWKEISQGSSEMKPDFDPGHIPAFAGEGVVNKAGKLYTTPLRLLEASDQFFKTLTKSGEIRAGMKPEQAAKSADYLLFRQAFDPTGELGQGGVLKIFDKWNNFVAGARRLPGGNWIVPFLQTPTNILKQGIEFSPLGVTTIPGAKQPIQQLSKAIVGTMVFTGASALAANNLTTWSMPTNPKEKELFMAAGLQPYSIKIGNKWVSYSKLGPLAYPIAMAAAYHDVATRNPDASTSETLTNALAGTLGFFADQSYVRSLGDFIGAIQNKGSFGGGFSLDSMSKQAANLAGQMVPYDAFMGWLTRLTDPYYKKPEGFIQNMESTIPGLSKNVPNYTDFNGNPSARDFPVANSISPLKISQEKPGFINFYNAQKQNVIQAGVEKRMGEDLKKGEVKTSGNKIMFIDTDGKVQTVDLSPIPPLVKTGNESMDKLAVSEYKSEITKQKKAIKALYDAKQIKLEDATAMMEALDAQYDAAGGGSKKKGASIKIKATEFKTPGITQTKGSFKVPSEIKYSPAPITKLKTPTLPKSIKIAKRSVVSKPIKLKAYRNTLAGK